MRKKEDSVLISFGTTAQAMAMEECCRRDGMPGRLIPIPSFVSAGCGVGWKASGSRGGESVKLYGQAGTWQRGSGLLSVMT